MEFLGGDQSPDHQLIDFESAYAGAADHEPPHGDGTHGYGADGKGTESRAAHGECPGGGCTDRPGSQ